MLLADGNDPCTTIRPPHAKVVYPDGAAVPAQEDYRSLLGPEVPVSEAERFDFDERVRQPSVATVVATADTRRCANLLLTTGVRSADD